jgi:hypothetical protein
VRTLLVHGFWQSYGFGLVGACPLRSRSRRGRLVILLSVIAFAGPFDQCDQLLEEEAREAAQSNGTLAKRIGAGSTPGTHLTRIQ